MNAASQIPSEMAVLRVGGDDRVDFLQGQLCADIGALAAGRGVLTALNNRQGRAFCTALAVPAADAILLALPESQLGDTLARLKMYVLRAKVELDAAGKEAPLAGLRVDDAGGLPATAWETAGSNTDSPVIRLPGDAPRWLAFGSAAGVVGDDRWHYDDVRAGLPGVYPATREQFLPQSLNLDALGGISFEKGCYVGQEIIARLHFRGTVKRRMYLFEAPTGTAAPTPGTELVADGKSIGKVVDAAASGEGTIALAVCPVNGVGPTLPDGTSLRPVPLPYSLPED